MKPTLGHLATVSAIGLASSMAHAEGAFDSALRLDPENYTTITVTLDGTATTLRRYEVVYVGQPVALAAEQPARQMGPSAGDNSTETLENLLAYETLVAFVPETATEDSAIVLNVENAGWMASPVREDIEDGGSYVSTSNDDKAGAALAAGYVFVNAGTRGRGILAADGTQAGQSPAAVVDTKAAIRWLRLNDDVLPGSAERIVLTGTSGGGGLTSVVSASGDSADYLPYLAAVGAAGVAEDGTSTISDAVFAAIAYCPITDLGHADLAYEWLYGSLRTAESVGEVQLAASAALAAAYPDYLASLGLTLADGTALTAETMRGAIEAEVIAETERHLAEGGTVPALGETFEITLRGRDGEQTSEFVNDWLGVENGAVTSFDLQKYLTFVSSTSELKAVPAFDRTANSGNEGVQGENSLFGTPDMAYSNFTPWGWNHNEVVGDGSGPDDTGMDWDAWVAGDGAALAEQLHLINPLDFLGSDSATPASYWYVRHGMIDRDTSFPVEIVLSRAIAGDERVLDVNFALPWMTPHSGNYDVLEAYTWLAGVLAEAGPASE